MKNIVLKPEDYSSKKILILHTGGTFGMDFQLDYSKQSHAHEFLNNLIHYVPELSDIAKIEIHVVANLDSSDATPQLWIDLATHICNVWDDFDGFVVIHGTDTMAWTASALAFFMSGLTKSIVFTGSQRPLSAKRNDARANIIDAVELATYGFPEVMVCFDSKVYRGTRVTKYSNDHLQAFRSYNAPILGRFGVTFNVNSSLLLSVVPPVKRHRPCLETSVCSHIISLECLPGANYSDAFLEQILQNSQAIILRGFGSGNLPLGNSNWKQLCKMAGDLKIPVVMSSHCPAGSVQLELYNNGRVYFDLGVVSSLDMTYEAMSVKLMIMLGRKIPYERRHEFFSTSLAGECLVKCK